MKRLICWLFGHLHFFQGPSSETRYGAQHYATFSPTWCYRCLRSVKE